MKQTRKRRIAFWMALAVILGGGVCVLACIVLLVASGLGQVIYDVVLFPQTIKIGSAAPDFELPTLSSETIRLSGFRGKAVRLHEQYPELMVLSIDSKEDEPVVRAYMESRKVTFTVVLDGAGKAASAYHVYAIPTVVFVDSDGVIRARYVQVLSEAQIAASLQAIGIEP